MEIIPSKTIMQAVYDTIRKAIINGNFKPGEQLIEAELIDILKVSRTPIREALRRLETEKLVVRKPYKGVFVNRISNEYASQLYQVQSILEGLAAKLACHNINPEFMSKLVSLTKEATEHKENGNYELMIEKCRAFHQLIWKQSNNVILQEILERLQMQINLLRGKTLLDTERIEENLDEHWEMLEHFTEKRDDLVQKAMTKHIEHAAIAAMKIFKEQDQ